VTTSANAFLTSLQSAAQKADRAEDELQREIVERRKAIEQARKFAYRRYNFMRAVAGAVANAQNRQEAVDAALASLRSSVGWSGDSEARQETMADFVPVAEAVFVSFAPEETEPPEADVLGALAQFEARYLEKRGVPFWNVFENYFPETPVVDF
jgi:hypothetical protein